MKCQLLSRPAAAAIAFAIIAAIAPAVEAGYKMCALREGPTGPCTCKTDSDEPGQFSEVARKYCRPAADPSKKPKETAAGGETTKPPSGETTPVATTAPETADPAPAAAAEPPAATAEPPQAAAATAKSEPPPAVAVPSPPPVLPYVSQKVAEIRARGTLTCGINTGLLGFSQRDQTGLWTGLDTDFCRAVAAAVLGDAGKVDFIPLETNERFDALATGKVDLLARNTTWTMNRDVDLGFDFAGILYYDGQGFATGSERGLVSAQQLAGTKVCVEAGTTTERNLGFYFKTQQIAADVQAFPTREEMLKAYLAGTCEAYSADTSALYAERAEFAEPLAHAILPEVISKEPLGPLVKSGDQVFSEIVRWTLAGLINAEEVGLDRASAKSSDPLGDDAERLVAGAGTSGEKLGLSKTWLRDVVASVGNYGEMFEANIGKSSPLGMTRGLNALWKRGGLVYAPPMW